MKIIFILLLTINLLSDSEVNFKDDSFNSIYGVTTEGNLLSRFKDSRIALKAWLEDIAKIYKGNVTMKFYDSSKPLYKDFTVNKLDMIIVDLPFFFKNKDDIENKSHHLWSMIIGEHKFDQLYLVANKSKNLKGFKDLKNKTIAIKKGNENIKIWLEKKSYEENKKSSNKLLKNIRIEKKDRTALLRVFFGKTDYAIVSKNSWNIMLELNPSFKNKIEILDMSDNIFLPFIGFFSKKANINSIDTFFKASNNLSEYEGGKQIVELLNIRSIYKVPNNTLIKLEKYYKEYFKLKESYK
ncbi:MAG: hypothetical protein GY932_05390 [Arcobacter sp.]|nr:hypothetical protein [Arcobacter sp.]